MQPSVNDSASSSNYSFTFPFEDNFELDKARYWVDRYWTASFLIAAVYLAAIPLGKRWMANRPRYELRGPLICWNLALSTFSLVGACRTVPEILRVTRNIGLYHSVCVPRYRFEEKIILRVPPLTLFALPSYIDDDKVSGFWSVIFVVSKLPELGDTVFIVLRKQPLMFLHWYHHATVLVYCWYAFADYNASARWFVTMNYSIHTAMYAYYALRAMRFRVPKFVSMAITAAQLIQMVVGCTINTFAYQVIAFKI